MTDGDFLWCFDFGLAVTKKEVKRTEVNSWLTFVDTACVSTLITLSCISFPQLGMSNPIIWSHITYTATWTDGGIEQHDPQEQSGLR